MKTLLALLSLALYSKAILIKVTLQIDEHGVHYNQTEEYDPLTADVITYVPAHQRDGLKFLELTKIENEGLGILVWKLSEENFCHIDDLDPGEEPLLFVLEAATME